MRGNPFFFKKCHVNVVRFALGADQILWFSVNIFYLGQMYYAMHIVYKDRLRWTQTSTLLRKETPDVVVVVGFI